MRVENGYVVFDTETLKRKKITGHSFVDIAGLNPYAKKGDALLERFGIVKFEGIEEKYVLRGEYAEKIVRALYQKHCNIVIYNPKDINYDNFPDNKDFGGLIDIKLPNSQGVVEVKSKSMKDYDKILEKQPVWEIMQACLYAYLGKENYAIVEWIFFDEETENQIINKQPVTTLANLKRITKQYEMSGKTKEFTENQMQKVLDYYNKCYNEKRIPLEDISDEMKEKLGIKEEIDWADEIGKTLFGTLPF